MAWTKQFGTSNTDIVGGVATYGSNTIYVIGYTAGNIAGSKGVGDAFIRKYTASGSVVWTRQFGTLQNDGAEDIALDDNGNAYVVGSTSGSLGAANGGSSDMFIRKYNSSGNVVWTKQLHTSRSDIAKPSPSQIAASTWQAVFTTTPGTRVRPTTTCR